MSANRLGEFIITSSSKPCDRPDEYLCTLLVADDAQLLAERDDALHDLLLHEVEAHGEHGHPEEDVHEAEQELEGGIQGKKIQIEK